MTFDELGLGPNVLKAVNDAGYTEPTPIQAQAIPHVIAGGDVTGIAQTGTGKTAAFVLPMIHRLARGRARARMPRCVILAPTRELAAQVSENFEIYGKYLKLSMALLIGGVSFSKGCYKGQEIVARMEYRGKPKTRTFGLRIDGSSELKVGDKFTLGNQSAVLVALAVIKDGLHHGLVSTKVDGFNDAVQPIDQHSTATALPMIYAIPS